jgi:hypothetical protein
MTIEGIKRSFDAGTSSSDEYNHGIQASSQQTRSLRVSTNDCPVTGDCTIEFYYGTKDVYRAAPGLNIPVLWPFDRFPFETCPKSNQIANELEDRFKNILSNHRITFGSFDVWTSGRSGLPDTKKDTLIIRTPDENPSITWRDAATRIQQIIDEAANRVGTNLRVEIRNEKLMYQPRYFTIEADSYACRTLHQVKQQINETVQALIPGSWKTIGFSMCGSFDDPASRVPTLLVGVKPGSTHRWDWVTNQMSDFLKSLPQNLNNLDVEFVPSVVELAAAGQGLKAERYSIRDLPPKPGMTETGEGLSIGPRGPKDEAGSFGFWVKWQPKDSEEIHRAFMSCYHVIENGSDAGDRQHYRQYGIGLNGDRLGKPIIVDYPAYLDAEHTRTQLAEELQKKGDPTGKLSRTLQTIDRYRSQGGLGQVRLASGRRLRNKRRMDWMLAVVNKPEDFGVNQPPPPFFSRLHLFNRVIYEKPAPNETVSRVGPMTDLPIKNWVAKQGRMTNITAGDVQKLRETVRWDNGMISEEPVVHSAFGLKFTRPGDSGSMVVNAQKELVGMVIGVGVSPDRTYITPVQDIFDDIKENGGGIVTLP